MIEQRFSIGIDISADDFYVSLMWFNGKRYVIKGSRKFSNNNKGFLSFLEWASKRTKGDETIFVMEATGVYYEELAYYLHSQGKSVAVILANKIKHYANSLNVKTKTDKVDAKTIAQFGFERRPDLWKPMSSELRDLRYLCRERLSLKKELTRIKNQLHALIYSHNANAMVLDLKQQHITFIDNAIEKIEKQITALIDSDKELKEGVRKLETIPSIRKLTIITVLCETNGFWGFNSIRQVISYAGLDVKHHQSGKYAGKSKISKQGNVYIRQCLYRQFQKTSCFLIFHLKLLANSLIFIFKSQRVCFIFLFAQKTVFCPITFHKKAHQSQSIIVFLERLFFKLIFF